MNVELNGAIIHYKIKGNGQYLCFVHGFSLDNEIWDYQFEHLSKYYSVLKYDLRGFGLSTIKTNTVFSHSEDLKLLLEYLKIDKVTLVGMSLGARITLDFALSYPDKVNGIVISAPSIYNYKDSFLQRLNIRITALSAKIVGIRLAKKIWLKHPFFKSLDGNPEIKSKIKEIVNRYSGYHWLKGSPFELPGTASSKYTQNIVSPTLILLGEFEVKKRKDLALQLSDNIKNSKIEIIRNGGHMINIENPKAYTDHILNFMRQHYEIRTNTGK